MPKVLRRVISGGRSRSWRTDGVEVVPMRRGRDCRGAVRPVCPLPPAGCDEASLSRARGLTLENPLPGSYYHCLGALVTWVKRRGAAIPARSRFRSFGAKWFELCDPLFTALFSDARA